MTRKKSNLINTFFLTIFTLLLFFSLNVAPASAQKINPDIYQQLKYRFIGPQGNRVIAVVGVPGDPAICYAGAASGGIFKSTDGGVHWDPIFDDQPVSSNNHAGPDRP